MLKFRILRLHGELPFSPRAQAYSSLPSISSSSVYTSKLCLHHHPYTLPAFGLLFNPGVSGPCDLEHDAEVGTQTHHAPVICLTRCTVQRSEMGLPLLGSVGSCAFVQGVACLAN